MRILVFVCDLLRVLIETLWNVNNLAISAFTVLHQVLIETLWNVNYSGKEEAGNSRKVLIETLWNVNMISLLSSVFSALSINRNIVECKSAL